VTKLMRSAVCAPIRSLSASNTMRVISCNGMRPMAPIGSTAEIFPNFRWVEKGRILRANDDVSFVQPVERAPCGHAVDRHDERFPDLVALRSSHSPGHPDRTVSTLSPGARQPSFTSTPEQKGVWSGAQDDHADVGIGSKPAPKLAELRDHRAVEAIEPLGTISR